MNKFYLYKKIDQYDFTVAHLYEHIFIACFLQHLENRGFSLGFFGWIAGNTYDNVIVFECGFYDAKAEKCFHEFIKKPLKITDEILDLEVKAISAENQTTMKLNQKLVIEELKKIADLPLLSLENEKPLEEFIQKKSRRTSKLIKINRHSKDNFEQFTTVFIFKIDDLKQKAVLFRIWPILITTFGEYLSKKGGYMTEARSPAINKHSGWMLMGTKFTIKKGVLKKQALQNELDSLLRNINFQDKKSEIKTYIESFRDSIDFAHIPEDILADTGILVSRSKIAELFTTEMVQKVWDSLEIVVEKQD